MRNHDKICAKSVSTLLLLCFSTALFQFLFYKSPVNFNLVYCPLQNKWVKSGEEMILAIKDFNDFCATDKRKGFIKTRIQLKTRYAPIISENLVFDYLEKGNRIFFAFNLLPEIPLRELTGKSPKVTAGNNFFDGSIKFAAEKLSLKQSARPPTFSGETNFSFQFIRDLTAISRNIKPRSPPFFV